MRVDIGTLRAWAGEAVFARGEAYFREGRVRVLGELSGALLAQVSGSELYTVRLAGEGRALRGSCTCPAFDREGLCKHMVAAALAAGAAEGEDAEDGAGAGLERIRRHLAARGVDALVEMILDIASRDEALLGRLEIAAASAGAEDGAISARLAAMLDRAMRIRGYVEYAEAGDWTGGVEAALDAVEDLVGAGRAPLAMQLAERAREGIESAIGSIDDSDSGCVDLLERCRDIHLSAAAAARPDPVELARFLFERELACEYGVFDGACELYAEPLGEAGRAEYRRLAWRAWAALPPRSGPGKGPAGDAPYDELRRILDGFAEREGDLETRIALRAKDLSTSWSYRQLVAFCMAHGREAEALRRAEEGLWLFEDQGPDEPLVIIAAGLMAKAGRSEAAVETLLRAFEKAPSLELYGALGEAGGAAARARAFGLLEKRLEGAAPDRWRLPAELPVRILMREKAFDAAWAMARRHGVSTGLWETLAKASEASHPSEALQVYEARVDRLAETGGDPAYREAAGYVARMAGLREPREQAAYVAGLRAKFGRKRNFMRLLA